MFYPPQPEPLKRESTSIEKSVEGKIKAPRLTRTRSIAVEGGNRFAPNVRTGQNLRVAENHYQSRSRRRGTSPSSRPKQRVVFQLVFLLGAKLFVVGWQIILP